MPSLDRTVRCATGTGTRPSTVSKRNCRSNIASSTYLDVERKEQIKPIFNAFYSDLAARSFKVFDPGTPNMELLNQLAKQIQEGKTAEALASVRRLQELHSEELAQLVKKTRPSVLDAFITFFTKPLNLVLFILVYAAALMAVIKIKRRRRQPWRDSQRPAGPARGRPLHESQRQVGRRDQLWRARHRRRL